LAFTEQELRDAHLILQQVVALHDEKYLPLLNILDGELHRRESAAAWRDLVGKGQKLRKACASRRKRRPVYASAMAG